MKVAGIILAAGESSSMKGQNKLISEVVGKPVLVWVVETAVSAGLEPVIVVTGYDDGATGKILADLPADIVLNNRWQEGMSTSFPPAVNALPSTVQGVMILLGDMPAVNSDIVKKLVSQFAASGGEKIVHPVFGGQQGNPVVFPRCFFPALTGLTGDSGAKSILKEHPDTVLKVEVDSSSILLDIDTEDDLTKMEHFLREK
jgi:molybdenum cofactor cytidylyltransferase